MSAARAARLALGLLEGSLAELDRFAGVPHFLRRDRVGGDQRLPLLKVRPRAGSSILRVAINASY